MFKPLKYNKYIFNLMNESYIHYYKWNNKQFFHSCKIYLDILTPNFYNPIYSLYFYIHNTKNARKTIDIKRNTYETMIGEYGRVLFEYDTFKNGIEVRETSARVTETINTDFLNEAEANLLESLLVSTKVDVVQDGTATTYTVPVTIKDSKFIRKTIANNKLIQYTITIEYSQPLNTNS